MLAQAGCRIAVTMPGTIAGCSLMANIRALPCVVGVLVIHPWRSLNLIQSGVCTRRMFYKKTGSRGSALGGAGVSPTYFSLATMRDKENLDVECEKKQ